MAYADFFSSLKAGYASDKAAIEAKDQAADQALTDIDQAVKDADDAGYKRGVASWTPPSAQDPAVQYTQADVDKIVATTNQEADAKYQPQIDALTQKLSDVQAKLDAAPADKDAALKALQDKLDAEIADLKAKFAAMTSKVQAAEDEFGSNLAPIS